MTINISSEPISLESGTVEEVQDFIYLGSNISTNGGADKDVDLRIYTSRRAFRTYAQCGSLPNYP